MNRPRTIDTNKGPIWGRLDPGGPHVCPMNFAIWVNLLTDINSNYGMDMGVLLFIHEETDEKLQYTLFHNNLSMFWSHCWFS